MNCAPVPRSAGPGAWFKDRDMSSEDKAYLIARAEAELELAQRASHPHAVRAHYEIASSYLDRVYPEEAKDEEG